MKKYIPCLLKQSVSTCMLFTLLMFQIPAPVQADILNTTIQVNSAQFIHNFSTEMLGVAMANWEHSWGKPFPGEVPGLAQAYKAAHIGLIRYAGGLWANSVGWERLPQRTPYTAWTPARDNYHQDFKDSVDVNEEYYFHYGTDEIDSLARLAAAADANVMIQVNIANDDPAMWADMVHYANIENNYAFKYWEIGNELDHDSGAGVTPEEYGIRLARYIDAMKVVDPTIVVVGGVPASAHDGPRQGWSDAVTDMSHYLIESAELTTAAGRKIDSLSYHWYQNGNTDNIEDIIRWNWSEVERNSWRNSYSRIWSEIAPARVEEEIILPNIPGASQGITELNFDAQDFDQAPQESNHMIAVWMADSLGRLACNGLDYVTWYEGFGSPYQGYPMIVREPDTDAYTEIRIRPTYYATYMYGNYFGNRLVEASSGLPTSLSVYASTDTRDPGSVKLMITNISADTITAPIAVQGFSPETGEYYQLSSSDPENMSNASNLNSAWTTINGQKLIDMAVSTSQIPSMALDVHNLQLTFPPYTVTAVILREMNNRIKGLPWNFLLLK